MHFKEYSRLAGLLLLAIGISWFAALSLVAQEIRIVHQRGPYYVGDPMVIQVQVSGVQASQSIQCTLEGGAPDGVTVNGPQASKSSNSFTQIVNGRVTTSESVDFRYNFLVTADRKGEFKIGPFTVNVDSRRNELEGVTVEFGELDADPNMALELVLPRSTIYVGERVPIDIRWSFAGDDRGLQFAFQNLQIRSSMFDQFEFVDSEPTSRTTLTLATAQGTEEVDAIATQESRDGKDWIVVTGQRLFKAESVGQFEGIRATCRTQRPVNWGRDIFGNAKPRTARPVMATAEPLNLRVIPVPLDNQPAGYSGAVGSGFSIDVAADRSVLRVGDPISLAITLQGTGNLEELSLPLLATALDEQLFQLPAERPAGTFQGNSKVFKCSVRVKDKSVSQLPGLPFSWFDPVQEKYVTTYSKPIALQVTEAQVISAAEVVSSNSGSPGGNSANSNSDSVSTLAPGTPIPTDLNFVGANLAIEKNYPSLVATSRGLSGTVWLVPSMYVSGLAILLGGLAVRAVRNRAPNNSPSKAAIKQLYKEIRDSYHAPVRETSAQIASALRRLVALQVGSHDAAVNRVIAECDNLAYAPQANEDVSLKKALIARALMAADELQGKPLK